ncbi:MAG: peptidoglycan DD-metalloendopeptidase family protein [Nocardioidaceae bacterium]
MRFRYRIFLIALAVGFCLGVLLDAFVAAAPTRSAPDDRRWAWPLDPQPEVVEAFDSPADPYGPGHRGIDLTGQISQSVLAVADGRVRFAGIVAGRGVVVIEHGAERSTYEPVVAAVDVGDPVDAGQVIGRLELVGSHCWPGSCLHLGRVAGDTYRDPLELLGGAEGPVRLLPFHATTASVDPWRLTAARRVVIEDVLASFG